jgi:hypothetical protein
LSDIFISYKREDQPAARQLADALEREGWTVWWDPKLRAGEFVDDVIERALKESSCVVVIWSKLSVNSQYVKDEASYALDREKLVPVSIDEVQFPFRFARLHTPRLIGWSGSQADKEFRKLVEAIALLLGQRSHLQQKQDKTHQRIIDDILRRKSGVLNTYIPRSLSTLKKPGIVLSATCSKNFIRVV